MGFRQYDEVWVTDDTVRGIPVVALMLLKCHSCQKYRAIVNVIPTESLQSSLVLNHLSFITSGNHITSRAAGDAADDVAVVHVDAHQSLCLLLFPSYNVLISCVSEMLLSSQGCRRRGSDSQGHSPEPLPAFHTRATPCITQTHIQSIHQSKG